MAYIPPLNGGRINATISGNTAGAGALVSTGTLTLAGGNNITLSQAGNAITISGGGAGGSNTFGMSNLGNTSGTTGVVSGSAFQYLLAGGNNVTLSQSLNGSSGTLTISAAAQTNQTIGLYALGNTTQNSSTTLDARSLSFNGLGAATLGYSNGSIQVSVPTQTVQTQNMVSVGGSTGNIVFSNSNNVSFGANASTITASASFSQTNQTLGLYATGNTTQNSSTVLDARSLTINGLGNVSVGYSNGSIQISGSGGGGGGVAILAGGSTFSSGSLSLNASGALTIASTTGPALNLSVPASSSLVGINGISISSAGSTITINGAALSQTITTLSRWESPTDAFTSIGAMSARMLSVKPVYIPFNVSGSAMRIAGSMSARTNTSATTASANMSLWMGVYTQTGSSLSLASSGSASYAFQWSQSASTTATASNLVNGLRELTVPMSINMTPGKYWVAAVMTSATTYTNFAFSMYGNSVFNTAAPLYLSPLGSDTTVAQPVFLGQGVYSNTTVTSGPASMAMTDINITSASNVFRAAFYHAIYNDTY